MLIAVVDNDGKVVARITEDKLNSPPWEWLQTLAGALTLAKQRDQEIAAGKPKRQPDDEP